MTNEVESHHLQSKVYRLCTISKHQRPNLRNGRGLKMPRTEQWLKISSSERERIMCTRWTKLIFLFRILPLAKQRPARWMKSGRKKLSFGRTKKPNSRTMGPSPKQSLTTQKGLHMISNSLKSSALREFDTIWQNNKISILNFFWIKRMIFFEKLIHLVHGLATWQFCLIWVHAVIFFLILSNIFLIFLKPLNSFWNLER